MTTNAITNIATHSSDSITNTMIFQRVTNCCRNVFLYMPNQLRELDITGRSSLFQFSKALLIKEKDSSIKKIFKTSFNIIPIIPIMIVITFVIDNLLKYLKENKLDRLENNYENKIDACFQIDEKVINLINQKLFFSDCKEIGKYVDKVNSGNKEVQKELQNLQSIFFSKLEQIKSLSVELDSSIRELKMLKKLIYYKDVEIENISQNISFCRDNISKENYIDKLGNIETIYHCISNMMGQIDSTHRDFIREIFFNCSYTQFSNRIAQHRENFETNLHNISNDLNRESEIDYLKNLRDDVILNEITSYLYELLTYNEGYLKKSLLLTLGSQKDTTNILKNASRVIENYEKSFPFEEKENILSFIKKRNDYIEKVKNKLIRPNRAVTISDCVQQRSEIRSLINETNDKLKSLKDLPADHYLRERYLHSLEEKKKAVLSIDANLQKNIDDLHPFETKVNQYENTLNNCKIPAFLPTPLESSCYELKNAYSYCKDLVC